jgi:hypothetical protein
MWNDLLKLALRVIFYALLLAGVSVMMMQGARWPYELSFYGENGLIEWMQVFFLMVSIVALWRAGVQDKSCRPLIIVMILLSASMIIRELDKVLDTYVARHAWKLGVAGLVFFAGVVIYRHKQTFYDSLVLMTRRPSFGIMLSGGLIVLIFSRLFGYGDFWLELVDNRSVAREVKRIAEECTELTGYFFIMIGTFEYLYEACSMANRKKEAVPRSGVSVLTDPV